MTAPQAKQLRAGDTLIYSDGRPGHCGVRAVVLAVGVLAMTVQFEDRADTTLVRFDEPEWGGYKPKGKRMQFQGDPGDDAMNITADYLHEVYGKYA